MGSHLVGDTLMQMADPEDACGVRPTYSQLLSLEHGRIQLLLRAHCRFVSTPSVRSIHPHERSLSDARLPSLGHLDVLSDLAVRHLAREQLADLSLGGICRTEHTLHYHAYKSAN